MEYASLLLMIFTSLVFGIGAGIAGAVYRHILAYEPVLNWWFRFGNRFENKWFFKPVWGCEKCVAGQLAFWFYLGIVIFPRIVSHCRQYYTIWPLHAQQAAAAGALLFCLILAVSAAVATGKFLGIAIISLEK